MSFAIKVAFFEDLFFLPFFSSLCESNAYLEEVSSRVDIDGYKCCTHFFDFVLEFIRFFLREKYESFTFWVDPTAGRVVLVFWDMTADEDWSSTMECDICSLEIGLPSSETFYFWAFEDDSSLKFLDDFIVKKCFFILYDDTWWAFLFWWHGGIIWKLSFSSNLSSELKL